MRSKRIKSIYPGFLLWLAVLLLTLVVWVYLHYQRKLECIEQHMQEIEQRGHHAGQSIGKTKLYQSKSIGGFSS